MSNNQNGVPVLSPQLQESKRADAATMLATVRAGKVIDKDSATGASKFRAKAKAELKALKEMREGALKPLKVTENTIRSWFRAVEDIYEECVKVIDAGISEYHLAARQLERETFTAAADLHAVGNDIAARALVAESNTQSQRTTPKGTSVREVWTSELVSAPDVEREWCIPDEKRVEALARNTPPDAPAPSVKGFRFVKKVIVSGRAEI